MAHLRWEKDPDRFRVVNSFRDRDKGKKHSGHKTLYTIPKKDIEELKYELNMIYWIYHRTPEISNFEDYKVQLQLLCKNGREAWDLVSWKKQKNQGMRDKVWDSLNLAALKALGVDKKKPVAGRDGCEIWDLSIKVHEGRSILGNLVRTFCEPKKNYRLLTISQALQHGLPPKNKK